MHAVRKFERKRRKTVSDPTFLDVVRLPRSPPGRGNAGQDAALDTSNGSIETGRGILLDDANSPEPNWLASFAQLPRPKSSMEAAIALQDDAVGFGGRENSRHACLPCPIVRRDYGASANGFGRDEAAPLMIRNDPRTVRGFPLDLSGVLCFGALARILSAVASDLDIQNIRLGSGNHGDAKKRIFIY